MILKYQGVRSLYMLYCLSGGEGGVGSSQVTGGPNDTWVGGGGGLVFPVCNILFCS